MWSEINQNQKPMKEFGKLNDILKNWHFLLMPQSQSQDEWKMNDIENDDDDNDDDDESWWMIYNQLDWILNWRYSSSLTRSMIHKMDDVIWWW